ncbi:MAG TPA: polysaccharide deacetylase family protein [Spirochaetia bacterium]|nr:polysaccharide deacetylase family protein [Spirochaetia bacterium]HRV27416.1 polysaccharide deacetylase family protein [Spirochaetia bacterium]
MKKLIICIVLIAVANCLFADLQFLALDFNTANQVLFSARIITPGSAPYTTLFMGNVATEELTQLTFYPEAIDIVNNGRTLQIRNRFGIFVSNADFTALTPIRGLPSFVTGNRIQDGLYFDVLSAPSGAYFLYLNQKSYTRADIVLYDVATGTSTVVAQSIEFSYSGFPAIWSPDSAYFIYAKNGELFYFSIDQFKNNRVAHESWRKLGKGKINQVQWNTNGSLYYMQNTSVFRIRPEEFFTQGLYSGILSPGTLVGKIPFTFDANFDRFWLSPNADAILLCKEGRNVFYLKLETDDYGQPSAVSAQPYLYLQGNTIVKNVIWTRNGTISILCSAFKNNTRVLELYRIEKVTSLTTSFKQLDMSGASAVELSQDEQYSAVITTSAVQIRRTSDWSIYKSIPVTAAVLHVKWLDSDRLVLAGVYTTEIVSVSTGSKTLVALSQIDQFSWNNDSEVQVASGNNAYKLSGTVSWSLLSTYTPQVPRTMSAEYRVYLDEVPAGSYKNMIMVRSIKTLVTKPLIKAPAKIFAPFPTVDDPRDPLMFNFGSRIRRREVALVFNALDTTDGLVTVLDVLANYGIKSMFFINGEFVRRNPGAARLIAQSGHETGNLFFTIFDPTSSQYEISADFIKRGLARNEDEYYQATGKELSLFWHTPGYSVNKTILEAAKSMNYQYIGRDIDPLDWVNRLDFSTASLYYNVTTIIDKVMQQVKPGSIIPIRIGKPEGERETYLFLELPLLINALLSEGYSIVPVSTLIENLN